MLVELINGSFDSVIYKSKEKISFSPSENNNCSRFLVLNTLEQKRDKIKSSVDMGFSYYTTIGTALEGLILRGLKSVLKKSQYRIPKNNFLVNGIIDAIVEIDGKSFIVEIKTCGELPEQPKMSHYFQAHTYSFLLGLPVIILYVERKFLDEKAKKKEIIAKEFLYEKFDFDVARKISRSTIYAINNAIPNRDHNNAFAEPCFYCHFRGSCYNLKNTDKMEYLSSLYNYGENDELNIISKELIHQHVPIKFF